MNRGNKLPFCGIVWLLTISLTACTLSKPAREDIIGQWVERERTCGSDSAASCGCFEFLSDGRFEAWNIPSEHFTLDYKDMFPIRFNASGVWELDASSDDPFAIRRVKLTFGPMQGFPWSYGNELAISVDGKVLFKGQEGNRIIFERSATGCT